MKRKHNWTAKIKWIKKKLRTYVIIFSNEAFNILQWWVLTSTQNTGYHYRGRGDIANRHCNDGSTTRRWHSRDVQTVKPALHSHMASRREFTQWINVAFCTGTMSLHTRQALLSCCCQCGCIYVCTLQTLCRWHKAGSTVAARKAVKARNSCESRV